MIEQTIVFLNSLTAEIEFSKVSIIKILAAFSAEPSFKNLLFLNSFSGFTDYDDFHSLWTESISSFAYYKSEEKEKMLQLGAYLGTTDVKNQINTIKLYKTFFENYRNNALSEYDKYGKVSTLFGLFTGASVFILLL